MPIQKSACLPQINSRGEISMKTKQLLSLLVAVMVLTGLVPALGGEPASTSAFDISVFEKSEYTIEHNADNSKTISYYNDELFHVFDKDSNYLKCEPFIVTNDDGHPFFALMLSFFPSAPSNFTHVRFKGKGLEYTSNFLSFETVDLDSEIYEYGRMFLDKQSIEILKSLTESDIITVSFIGEKSTYEATLSSRHLEVMSAFIDDFSTATKGSYAVQSGYPYDRLLAFDGKNPQSPAQPVFDLSIFEKSKTYTINPSEEGKGYDIDFTKASTFVFTAEDTYVYSCYPYISIDEQGLPGLILHLSLSSIFGLDPLTKVFFMLDEDIYSLSPTFYIDDEGESPTEFTNLFLGEEGFKMVKAMGNAKKVTLGFVTQYATYAAPLPKKLLSQFEKITEDFLKATQSSYSFMKGIYSDQFALDSSLIIDTDALNPEPLTLFKQKLPVSFDFTLFENKQYSITPYDYDDTRYDIALTRKIRERFYLIAKKNSFFITCDPTIAITKEGEINFSFLLSCVSEDYLALDKVFFRLDDAYYTIDAAFSYDEGDDGIFAHDFVDMILDRSGFELIENMGKAEEVEIGFVTSRGILTRTLPAKTLKYLTDMAENFAAATYGTYGITDSGFYHSVVPTTLQELEDPSATILTSTNLTNLVFSKPRALNHFAF